MKLSIMVNNNTCASNGIVCHISFACLYTSPEKSYIYEIKLLAYSSSNHYYNALHAHLWNANYLCDLAVE